MSAQFMESLIENPSQEDSEDLTDAEIASAVDTTGAEDVVSYLREHGPLTIVAHELRRRGEDLFWRVRAASDRVFVFQVNWLGG